MNDWKKQLVAIGVIGLCFLLSPLLFPGNPGISEKLMYALFAVTGVGSIPIMATGISILRGKVVQ